MLDQIKSSVISKMLRKRDEKSHKGENGRVLIVGGSLDYYAPPVLAGLGAFRASADLVSLYVPECNFDCCRSLFPDFIVRSYPGEYLSERWVDQIVEFGKKKADSVLIGPGLGKEEKSLSAALEIVQRLNVPTVLDAGAIPVLKKIEKFPLSQPVVITPHSNEFRNLVDREMSVQEDDPKSIILLRSMSMDLHINVLLKGPRDLVSSDEGVVEVNSTGNAGMTVGGTGDVLAGVVATFLAQGYEAFDAARMAAYYVGKAGDVMAKQMGNGFVASDVAGALTGVIK